MVKIVDPDGNYLVDPDGNFIGESDGITAEAQKFSPSNLVVLFELDCVDLGGTILRFTSSANESTPIEFGGNTYLPIPVEAEGFEWASGGVLPQPRLRVLNTPSLQSGIISLKDLLGATVYRIKTFKTFLDNGDTPDPTAHFPIDIFKIDRKAVQNKVFVEWELAAAMDQEGRTIPARQIIRDYCTHIYRTYNEETGLFDYTKATCPYVGDPCFNDKDQATTYEEDRCGKRLSSCKARFGSTAQLPTRSFPGVAAVR